MKRIKLTCDVMNNHTLYKYDSVVDTFDDNLVNELLKYKSCVVIEDEPVIDDEKGKGKKGK